MKVGTENLEADDEAITCGWSCWKPRWLQKFATFPYFMMTLCFNALLQGMIVNGLISTSISSIEKRFNLSSTKSGIFASFYDVSVFFMLIPLSYYSNKVNKVRVIGYGMIIIGIGSIILTIPQFLDGNYTVGNLESDICQTKRESCNDSQSSSDWAYYCLLASQLLVGFGAAPIFTYGYSTVDEFDSDKKTARNMAYYMGAATLGPAFAFIGGGQLLNVWGDIFKTDNLELGISGPEDPRWYGAWWIGFIVVGFLCIIFGLPLTLFPKKLKDTDKRKMDDSVQTHSKLVADFSEHRFAFLREYKLFLCNATCMSLIAMQTVESMIMNGYITFVPKLFESMFGYSSSYSSTITGAIVVPMGVVGSWMGGRLSEKVNNQIKPMLKITIGLLVFTSICSSCLLLQCEEIKIAGVTHDYLNVKLNRRNVSTLMNTCNDACHCENIFNPVCSSDGELSYFSPCHAGCRDDNGIGAESWEQCTCSRVFNSTSRGVTKGWCTTDCMTTQILFFLLFSLVCLSIFASAPPIQAIAMRIVSFDHRDSYICFSWLWMRALGSIPGAILFGYVIDLTCDYWTKSCTDSSTKCVLYDAIALGRSIFYFTAVTKVFCIFALLVCLWSYSPIEEEIKTESSSCDDDLKLDQLVDNNNKENYTTVISVTN